MDFFLAIAHSYYPYLFICSLFSCFRQQTEKNNSWRCSKKKRNKQNYIVWKWHYTNNLMSNIRECYIRIRFFLLLRPFFRMTFLLFKYLRFNVLNENIPSTIIRLLKSFMKLVYKCQMSNFLRKSKPFLNPFNITWRFWKLLKLATSFLLWMYCKSIVLLF